MCKVDKCEMPEKKGRIGYCEKHYMRMYRTGTTEKTRKSMPHEHTGGYLLVPARGHPMAIGRSHAYEHRLVYFDAHGEGPFNCHWCNKIVSWKDLHIDHIDDIKTNNDIANLAPSCAICNQQRGRYKASFTWRLKTGITALGMTKTLSEWSVYSGIARASIKWRVQHGWTMDQAVSKPRGVRGQKSP
jgi:hypothetical protein